MSFYKCSLFEKNIEDYSIFEFLQKEIILETPKDTTKFKVEDVLYKCSFKQSKTFNNNKLAILIPIKDSKNLLEYTLKNLTDHKVNEHGSIVVIDDRSVDDLYSICKKYDVSYLRVDNKKGFNFSALNNIAAKIAYDNGFTEIILWNSDLWTDSENTLPDLIKLHRENNSTISGTKLVYPPFKWDGEDERADIGKMFNLKQTHRNTIQFGGSIPIQTENLSYVPIHAYRFSEKNFYLASEDKREIFVTGAFQIINLKWFISEGGLNHSLSKNFQDVEICLRCVEQDRNLYYFGKNNYFYHDESLSLKDKKNDIDFISDYYLYNKIWNKERFQKSIFKFRN